MTFVVSSILNCCLEYLSMLLIWNTLSRKSSGFKPYGITFLGLLGCAFVFTFVDSFLFSILPVNFTLIFASFFWGFHRDSFKSVFWNTLIVYSLLIFLQVVAISVTPIELIGTQAFNFIANGCVLTVTALFNLLAQKFHFQDYYAQNQQQVRIFFLILCVPEMITAQFFASVLTSADKFVVLLVLLLQLLYATALLLAFSMINRKNERRQYTDAVRHMDTLNDVLDSFKQDTHDFNKHIRHLQSIVETRTAEGNLTELREDISTYCNDLLAYSHEKELLLHLDSPTFRALLYGRRSQAEQKDIRLYIDATGILPSFPVKPYQLVEIFDNLMDNAFECVVTIPEPRWIRVALCCEQRENGKLLNVLRIQNPYETLDYEALVNQANYTSKGGSHQGIGLRKVEALVRATGGQLILGHEKQLFTVTVQYLT